MNTRRSWFTLALLLCALATIAVSVPSSLAYIASRSQAVENTFTVGDLPADEVSVPVRVRKLVNSTSGEILSPEGFRFALEPKSGGERLILTADADGMAAAELVFTRADLGNTYAYRLYEINDGRAHVTYSDAEYAVEIDVLMGEDHGVTAAVRVGGAAAGQIAAEFVNVYHGAGVAPALPHTGDSSSIALHMALLLGSVAALALLRRRRAAR